MRKAMKSCVTDMICNHNNAMFILIDIGAFGFQDLMKDYPERVKNIGIFEDGFTILFSFSLLFLHYIF